MKEWVIFWKGRYLLLLALGSIVGLLLCALLPLGVSLMLAVMAVVCLVFLFIFKIPYKRYGILALCGMLCAVFYFTLYHLFVFWPLQSYGGQTVIIEGKIDSEYSYNDARKGCIIDADSITHLGQTKRVHGKIWVTMEADAPEYNVAALVRLRAYVVQNPLQSATDITYNKSQKIYLSTVCEESRLLQDSAPYHPFRVITGIRAKLRGIYERYLSAEAAAFVTALTLGDRSFIESSVINDFRLTGVSHVLAVSGMHLAFVVSIISFLLSLAKIELRRRSGVILLFIFAYSALTGFSESCMRSAVMLAFYYIGVMIGREQDNYTALSVAVVLCCTSTPFAILSPSLCLSAGATLGMLLFSSRILSFMSGNQTAYTLWGRVRHFVFSSLSASFAALLGAFPWMIYIFRSVSILSPITNLLVAFVIQILFYLASSLLAFHWVPLLGPVLCKILEWLYAYCRWIVGALANFPVAVLHVDTPLFWVFTISFCVAFCFIWWISGRKTKYKRSISLCILLGCAVLCFGIEAADSFVTQKEVTAYFVSVGQGDTTLLVQNRRAVAVDCGGEGDGYFSLLDAMQKAGVREVEMIALTHFDRTHYNYAASLLRLYRVKTLVLPTREKYNDTVMQLISFAKQCGTKVVSVSEDTDIAVLDGVNLQVLTRQNGRAAEEHQNSLCYKVSFGQTDLLIMGDTSGDAQLWMEGYGESLKSDILKVASHGAADGCYPTVLQYIAPRDAIISTGERNKDGTPEPTVLETLSNHCKNIWRTDQMGTICVRMKNNGYHIGV